MRKFLLFVSLVAASVTASAQEVKSLVTAPINSQSVKAAVLANSQTRKFNKVSSAVKPMVVKASAVKAAPSTLDGNYVELNPYDEYTYTDSCVVKGISYTDATSGETYNIELSFGMGYVDLIGKYDAETGVITVPAQKCGTTESYGDLYFYGATASEEQEGYYNLSDGNATFTVDDNGAIYADQDAYFVLYDAGTEDDSSDDGTWMSALDVSFLPANGIMSSYYYNSRTTSWSEEQLNSVAIEDYETSINVSNFLGYWGLGGTVSMDINEDLTVSMPTFQNIFPATMYYGSAWNNYSATFGDYMKVYCYGEDGYLSTGQDIENIVGFLSGNVITLGATDSQGSNRQGIFFGSNYVTDQGAYGLQIDGLTITLNNGKFAAGINEVNGTREDLIKNTKTYNLAGQVVDKAYKGIVIKNGKKYIQK